MRKVITWRAGLGLFSFEGGSGLAVSEWGVEVRCGSGFSVPRSRFPLRGVPPAPPREDSYLVDPASSHMLVSKIKPCMSQYKHVM